MSMSYVEFFSTLTGYPPHDWQTQLGDPEPFSSRLIRVPTGLGKTRGVLLAWMYHRIYRKDERWPRRMLWNLPMRVLVEQTVDDARSLLTKAAQLIPGFNSVGVHVLMGGVTDLAWQMSPEKCAVLIGTHDMLLSRALNRGYAAPRARWPLEFGLLHHDALWVFDEVQLMDTGLATSAQLHAFRENDRSKPALRPCGSWWMSATLQRNWLESVDTAAHIGALGELRIAAEQRCGELWHTRKVLELKAAEDDAIGELVMARHMDGAAGSFGRVTLVVLNKVDRAVAVFQQLKSAQESKKNPLKGVDLRLVHSRFRPRERADWREAFLRKEVCAGADRIIVATQVVEAGVDVSATTLITDLAPWPSLVQRFGRAARWGGDAQIIVLTRELKNEKDALPYKKEELDAARDLALKKLDDVAQARLEDFEASLPAGDRQKLYPYNPPHLLLRHEWEELFDTTPDLTGADIDISRFIRSGEERDVQVFWRELKLDEKKNVIPPGKDVQPEREELCSVPFLKAQSWLCGTATKTSRPERLLPTKRAWIWDWLDERWRSATRRDLYPGQTVLVDAACGGYDPLLGWSRDARAVVSDLSKEHEDRVAPDVKADSAQGNDAQSQAAWKTIATHGREAGQNARELAGAMVPALADLLDVVLRWHDIGKAHPCFQGSMRHAQRPRRHDLAKAPTGAWPRQALYMADDGDQRAGFRHELASMLALFAVLERHQPDHPALLGPWREFFPPTGGRRPANSADVKVPAPTSIEREILALDAERFDLLAYLVCAHHGKVRLALHAAPADQEYPRARTRGAPIRGVCESDVLPDVLLFGADGKAEEVPGVTLRLDPARSGLSPRTGRSWTERSLALLAQHGPAKLAWLEALVRAADVRASQMDDADPLLPGIIDTNLEAKLRKEAQA